MDDASAQTVIEESRIAYGITDRDLIIRVLHGSAEIFCGQNLEAAGQPLLDLAPELIGSESALAEILAGDLPRFQLTGINRETPAGQTRYVVLTTVPHRDEAGAITGVIHIVEDVTELGTLGQHILQRRNELRLIRDQLEQTNRELTTTNQAREQLLRSDNARLVEELQQRLEEVRRSQHLIIAAEESLRREIAEMLHGSLQTRLLLVWHRLGQCEQLVQTDPVKAAELLAGARIEIDRIREQDVRDASHLLHPTIIRVGLIPAVRSLTSGFEGQLRISLAIDPALAALDDPAANRLPEPLRLAVYRIVEEALTNTYRHASASHAEIDLHLERDGSLVLRVRDDGVGFDPRAMSPGLGLSSVAGRVSQFGGRWQIISDPGNGATLTAIFPRAIEVADIETPRE